MYGDIYCTDLTHFTWWLTVSIFLDLTLITMFCNLLLFLDHLNVRCTASLPHAAARAGVTQATRRELAWLWPVPLRRRPLYSKHCSCKSISLGRVACENIRFSSLFATGDVSRGVTWCSSARNVPSYEERGETDVFAGYGKGNRCVLGLGKIDLFATGWLPWVPETFLARFPVSVKSS